ncbi:UNVERIFIED_ORG: hypothetical protein QE446_002579 [Rhizobium sp. SORGH_AS260]|nr:hypothetical protein [Rhizobium sp. SORGH_AS_0285]MDP9754703.1 hypothetical protein [Rhizobium sp. SORGH_AS_0260]MDR6082645.1 hypothetical protein [Agrobacterium sp. SORGH_AS_0440]MDR6189791.1 hypothetical protein [Agrobacterium pusense]SDE63203.1 hypothetical protein SAMN05421750_102615 [Agrobacterium pusense]
MASIIRVKAEDDTLSHNADYCGSLSSTPAT